MRQDLITGADTETYWKGLHERSLGAASEPEAALPIVCYPRHSAAFNRYVDRFQREAYLDGLRRIGSIRGRRALDIGCGVGRWLAVLASEGAAVAGVDLSPDAVTFCQRRVPEAHVFCSPLSEFAWAGDPFDLLSCVTVLQHVPWPDQPHVVQRVTQHLRPGGYALFLELVRTESEGRGRYEGTGSFANTRREWCDIFGGAGLTVAYECPVLFFPVVNGLYLPMKRVAGRVLRAMRLLPHDSSGTLSTAASRPAAIGRLEGGVDYWFLAATTPVSAALERLLARYPEERLGALGISASHRLFLMRRP